MKPRQSDRVHTLIGYIEANLNQTINGKLVEQVCHYSYRNMNRLFVAVQGETVGRYIQRRRLEKVAEYLCYSNYSVSSIVDKLDFNDIASFSKAFKNYFKQSPSAYRLLKTPFAFESTQANIIESSPLAFDIEQLPAFSYRYHEYQGDYADLKAIQQLWHHFVADCEQQGLIDEESILFGAILDDNEISEKQFCRYRAALITENFNDPKQEGFHSPQQYAKFVVTGNEAEHADAYQRIFYHWEQHVNRELADLPSLEFYHDLSEMEPEAENVTEIYIPIL